MPQFEEIEKKIKKIKQFGVDNNVPDEDIQNAVMLHLEDNKVTADQFIEWKTGSKEKAAPQRPPVVLDEPDAPTQQELSFLGSIAPGATSGMEQGDAGVPPDPETARLVNEIGFPLLLAIPGVAVAGAAGVGGLSVLGLETLMGSSGAFLGSMAAENFDPSNEPYKRALKTARNEAIGTVFGAGLGKILNKFLTKIGRGMSATARPGAVKAQAILNDQGETLLVNQAVDNPITDLAGSIAESSPAGTMFTKKAKRSAQIVAKEAADEFVDHISPQVTRLEIGGLVQDAINSGTDAFKAEARGKYGKVDRLLNPKKAKVELDISSLEGGVIVDVNGKPIGNKIIANAEKLSKGEGVDISSLKKEAKALLAHENKRTLSTPQSKGILKNITRRNDIVSFEDASLLRSDLLSSTRRVQEQVAGRSAGIGKQLSKTLDTNMSDAAKGVSDEAYQAWREANDFYKAGIGEFNNKFITKLSNSDPALVYSTVMKPGNASNIKKLKNIIRKQDPDAWQKLEGEFVRDIFEKSTTQSNKGIELTGSKILSNLKKFSSGAAGDATSAIMTDSNQQTLRTLAKAIDLAQSSPNTPFKVIAQMTQAGAGFGLVSGAFSSGSAVILMTPAVIGKMMSSPKIVNYLLKGAEWAKSGKFLASQRIISKAMTAIGAIGGIATVPDEQDPAYGVQPMPAGLPQNTGLQ